MRWLLHGDLTESVAAALRRHEHVLVLPAEIDLEPGAAFEKVLRAAHIGQLDIMTNDSKLAASPFESTVKFGRSIVLLLVQGAQEQDEAIERLFVRYKRLTPGRLYTVTPSRVKVRQLPGAGLR